jgi:hypothetical protein
MSAYPTPYSAPATPQDNRLVQELSLPIYQARGWLKLVGILSIIGGALQALSVVGILFCWLPIWMGILMLQAGSSIDAAAQLGDRFAFLRSLNSLKTYFVIQGVLTLIGILVFVLSICVAFVLPLLGITLVPWQQIINTVNTLPTY